MGLSIGGGVSLVDRAGGTGTVSPNVAKQIADLQNDLLRLQEKERQTEGQVAGIKTTVTPEMVFKAENRGVFTGTGSLMPLRTRRLMWRQKFRRGCSWGVLGVVCIL